MKRTIAVGLGVLVLIALLATSFVSARPLDANMDSHFQTIPGGSTNPYYMWDFIGSNRNIPLYTGWSTNLPQGTCAIAVRLAFKNATVGSSAILQPVTEGGVPVMAVVQTPNNWSSQTGIVPITGPNADVRLVVSYPGYVDIEITGYWTCDDYVRPTPTP